MTNKIVVLLLVCASGLAQPYQNGQQTRHRFAQSSLGLDLYYCWGGTILLPQNDSQRVNAALNRGLSPRIHLGGLHFWGHAEFYLNINLGSFRFNNSALTVKQSQGDIFGLKIFPKAVAFGKVNAYMGTALASSGFKAQNSARYNKANLPLTFGIFYFKRKVGFDFSFTYIFKNSYSYYYTRQSSFTVKQPSLLINLGIRRLFETTRSAEKDYLSGKTDSIYRVLRKAKRLNSFYVGGGPSSAFYLKEDRNNTNTFSFMGNKLVSIFPEVNFGYFCEPLRMHTALVFRYAVMKKSAFEVTQKFTRMAAGIESHFMLFDYHGFVPFLGPHLSYESLSYIENTGGRTTTHRYEGLKPGVVLGWDILPDKLQYFTLRTNLRYFPNLGIALKNGKTVWLDQIEFNFVELIYYPARRKNILRATPAPSS